MRQYIIIGAILSILAVLVLSIRNDTPITVEIDFQVKTENPEALEVFPDSLIPWISISNPEAEILNLDRKDDLVLQDSVAVILISYPLNHPTNVKIRAKSAIGFTRGELATAISSAYRNIYRLDGKTKQYGIWGHVIEDLDLSRVIASKVGKGTYQLELFIES